MKELFFGWLTKGQYQLSFLDSIMFIIEGIILMFLICCILVLIDYIKDKFKRKENNNGIRNRR